MPKSTSTFIKSKMNKDTDSRIIPNGEYRDAQNVNISKSEGADVCELENVLGNELMFNFRSDIQLTSFDNRYFLGRPILFFGINVIIIIFKIPSIQLD